MNLKKCLGFLFVLVITLAVCVILVVIQKDKQPVYTEAQKMFIGIANKKLESLGYEFEDTTFIYEEFDAFDETVDRDQLPESVKSVKKYCVIYYSSKEKYMFGGAAEVYIDMETENILHVNIMK